MSRKFQRGELSSLSKFLVNANSTVLETENQKEFNRLLAAIRRTIRPQNLIEELHVMDYATAQWEIQCLRRTKRQFIDMEQADQFSFHLREILANFEAKKEKNEFIQNQNDQALCEKSPIPSEFSDPIATQYLIEQIGGIATFKEKMETKVIVHHLDTIEQINRMIDLSERRRDRCLQRIAYYRDSFATKVEQTVQKVFETNIRTMPRIKPVAAKKSAA